MLWLILGLLVCVQNSLEYQQDEVNPYPPAPEKKPAQALLRDPWWIPIGNKEQGWSPQQYYKLKVTKKHYSNNENPDFTNQGPDAERVWRLNNHLNSNNEDKRYKGFYEKSIVIPVQNDQNVYNRYFYHHQQYNEPTVEQELSASHAYNRIPYVKYGNKRFRVKGPPISNLFIKPGDFRARDITNNRVEVNGGNIQKAKYSDDNSNSASQRMISGEDLDLLIREKMRQSGHNQVKVKNSTSIRVSNEVDDEYESGDYEEYNGDGRGDGVEEGSGVIDEHEINSAEDKKINNETSLTEVPRNKASGSKKRYKIIIKGSGNHKNENLSNGGIGAETVKADIKHQDIHTSDFPGEILVSKNTEGQSKPHFNIDENSRHESTGTQHFEDQHQVIEGSNRAQNGLSESLLTSKDKELQIGFSVKGSTQRNIDILNNQDLNNKVTETFNEASSSIHGYGKEGFDRVSVENLPTQDIQASLKEEGPIGSKEIVVGIQKVHKNNNTGFLEDQRNIHINGGKLAVEEKGQEINNIKGNKLLNFKQEKANIVGQNSSIEAKKVSDLIVNQEVTNTDYFDKSKDSNTGARKVTNIASGNEIRKNLGIIEMKVSNNSKGKDSKYHINKAADNDQDENKEDVILDYQYEQKPHLSLDDYTRDKKIELQVQESEKGDERREEFKDINNGDQDIENYFNMYENSMNEGSINQKDKHLLPRYSDIAKSIRVSNNSESVKCMNVNSVLRKLLIMRLFIKNKLNGKDKKSLNDVTLPKHRLLKDIEDNIDAITLDIANIDRQTPNSVKLPPILKDFYDYLTSTSQHNENYVFPSFKNKIETNYSLHNNSRNEYLPIQTVKTNIFIPSHYYYGKIFTLNNMYDYMLQSIYNQNTINYKNLYNDGIVPLPPVDYKNWLRTQADKGNNKIQYSKFVNKHMFDDYHLIPPLHDRTDKAQFTHTNNKYDITTRLHTDKILEDDDKILHLLCNQFKSLLELHNTYRFKQTDSSSLDPLERTLLKFCNNLNANPVTNVKQLLRNELRLPVIVDDEIKKKLEDIYQLLAAVSTLVNDPQLKDLHVINILAEVVEHVNDEIADKALHRKSLEVASPCQLVSTQNEWIMKYIKQLRPNLQNSVTPRPYYDGLNSNDDNELNPFNNYRPYNDDGGLKPINYYRPNYDNDEGINTNNNYRPLYNDGVLNPNNNYRPNYDNDALHPLNNYRPLHNDGIMNPPENVWLKKYIKLLHPNLINSQTSSLYYDGLNPNLNKRPYDDNVQPNNNYRPYNDDRVLNSNNNYSPLYDDDAFNPNNNYRPHDGVLNPINNYKPYNDDGALNPNNNYRPYNYDGELNPYNSYMPHNDGVLNPYNNYRPHNFDGVLNPINTYMPRYDDGVLNPITNIYDINPNKDKILSPELILNQNSRPFEVQNLSPHVHYTPDSNYDLKPFEDQTFVNPDGYTPYQVHANDLNIMNIKKHPNAYPNWDNRPNIIETISYTDKNGLYNPDSNNANLKPGCDTFCFVNDDTVKHLWKKFESRAQLSDVELGILDKYVLQTNKYDNILKNFILSNIDINNNQLTLQDFKNSTHNSFVQIIMRNKEIERNKNMLHSSARIFKIPSSNVNLVSDAKQEFSSLEPDFLVSNFVPETKVFDVLGSAGLPRDLRTIKPDDEDSEPLVNNQSIDNSHNTPSKENLPLNPDVEKENADEIKQNIALPPLEDIHERKQDPSDNIFDKDDYKLPKSKNIDHDSEIIPNSKLPNVVFNTNIPNDVKNETSDQPDSKLINYPSLASRFSDKDESTFKENENIPDSKLKKRLSLDPSSFFYNYNYKSPFSIENAELFHPERSLPGSKLDSKLINDPPLALRHYNDYFEMPTLKEGEKHPVPTSKLLEVLNTRPLGPQNEIPSDSKNYKNQILKEPEPFISNFDTKAAILAPYSKLRSDVFFDKIQNYGKSLPTFNTPIASTDFGKKYTNILNSEIRNTVILDRIPFKVNSGLNEIPSQNINGYSKSYQGENVLPIEETRLQEAGTIPDKHIRLHNLNDFSEEINYHEYRPAKNINKHIEEQFDVSDYPEYSDLVLPPDNLNTLLKPLLQRHVRISNNDLKKAYKLIVKTLKEVIKFLKKKNVSSRLVDFIVMEMVEIILQELEDGKLCKESERYQIFSMNLLKTIMDSIQEKPAFSTVGINDKESVKRILESKEMQEILGKIFEPLKLIFRVEKNVFADYF